MNREQYLAMRRDYMPDRLRLIFLCESPPKSENYFYDETGKVSEPLFRAMMLDVLKCKPENKVDGLAEFQSAGYLLVDSTYTPINKGFTNAARKHIILEDYEKLVNDLVKLDGIKRTPILMIKANVCRLLDARLTKDGFPTLNKGRLVYFPSSGQQGKFRKQICSILSERPDLLP